MKKTQILTFSCPDGPGIQAKVTGIMYAHNAFLTDVTPSGGFLIRS